MPPPKDLVKKAADLIEKQDNKKNQEALNKHLQEIKKVIYGSAGSEPNAEAVNQLAKEIYESDLLFLLVDNMPKLDFEGKKDVVQIFNKLLKHEVNDRPATADYIATTKPQILTTLCQGYENPEIAMSTGMMLRECIKHDVLAKIILYSDELFSKFFEYVQQSQFDLASDAFASFKDLLTKSKIVAAKFLEDNYDSFMPEYKKLLASDNYVTKRQSVKLLGELLLDRANFTTMTKFISNSDNLKMMMEMLRHKSRNIQFEAFHVFKVFVANPNKTPDVLNILVKNKERLVQYLRDFHNDRAEDEQFNDEKEYLIKQISEL